MTITVKSPGSVGSPVIDPVGEIPSPAGNPVAEKVRGSLSGSEKAVETSSVKASFSSALWAGMPLVTGAWFSGAWAWVSVKDRKSWLPPPKVMRTICSPASRPIAATERGAKLV